VFIGLWFQRDSFDGVAIAVPPVIARKSLKLLGGLCRFVHRSPETVFPLARMSRVIR
jgi:hypothetical protein